MASSGDGKGAEKITTNVCYVCGDAASINNYGALSCFSCRTFFRRNAYHRRDLPVCRLDGLCDINTLTRRACTACRLAKCLSVGMTPDLIRREDRPSKKRKLDTVKTEEVPNHIITTTQTTSMSSDLSLSDHTLISNIVCAFDAFNPAHDIRQTIELLNNSTSDADYDLSQSLSVLSMFCDALQSFVSSIPDFKILTVVEQSSLFQRNMLGLFSLGSIYFMRTSGIFDQHGNEQILVPLYGHEALQQARSICEQFDMDQIPFVIMLVAIAFCSNNYMIDSRENETSDSLLLGTFRLFGSQNVYVELLWKYLIQVHDHHLAVQKLSALVKQLLDTMKFSVELVEKNLLYQSFIDHILEEMNNSSIINAKAEIPLWGKKMLD